MTVCGNRFLQGTGDPNLETLWKTVHLDLPDIIPAIEAFLDR